MAAEVFAVFLISYALKIVKNCCNFESRAKGNKFIESPIFAILCTFCLVSFFFFFFQNSLRWFGHRYLSPLKVFIVKACVQISLNIRSRPFLRGELGLLFSEEASKMWLRQSEIWSTDRRNRDAKFAETVDSLMELLRVRIQSNQGPML